MDLRDIHISSTFLRYFLQKWIQSVKLRKSRQNHREQNNLMIYMLRWRMEQDIVYR